MTKFEDFDYYEELQVDPSAEPDIVEATYKKLAQKYHPDINKSPSALAKMKRINIAHDVLSDVSQRQQYHTEWLRRKNYKVNPPIPTYRPTKARPRKPNLVVTPAHILFKDMMPCQSKQTTFVIDNTGGKYSKLLISKPNSWLRIIDKRPLSNTKELPMEVDIEATNSKHGLNSTEYICIELDDVKASIVVDIQTAPNKIQLSWRPKIADMAIGTIIGLLIVGIFIFAINKNNSPDPVQPVSTPISTQANTNNQPIINLIYNPDAHNPTYDELLDFLRADDTDKYMYDDNKMTAKDFALKLQNNATNVGIRCGYVEIAFTTGNKYACNVFDTTDNGTIFIDCVGDKSALTHDKLSRDKLAQVAKEKEYSLKDINTDQYNKYIEANNQYDLKNSNMRYTVGVLEYRKTMEQEALNVREIAIKLPRIKGDIYPPVSYPILGIVSDYNIYWPSPTN